MAALGSHKYAILIGQMCNVGDIINNTGIINIFGNRNTISQREGK